MCAYSRTSIGCFWNREYKGNSIKGNQQNQANGRGLSLAIIGLALTIASGVLIQLADSRMLEGMSVVNALTVFAILILIAGVILAITGAVSLGANRERGGSLYSKGLVIGLAIFLVIFLILLYRACI